MLKIQELIKPEYVFLDIPAKSRFNAIHKIVQRMGHPEEIEDMKRFEREVVRREREIPTGLAYGAALPHARSKAINSIVMAFARLKEGVDFGADSGEPARLIFLFGVPNDAINEYLKLVAKLCKLLREDDFRARLLNAETPEEVIEIIGDV